MSAIAGLWRFDGKPDAAAGCARMLASQDIYGPHDGHTWSDGPLAMGRRLFRTLPEDAYDRQPLQSRDGRLTLVADVRLDNRDELIGSLGLGGEARQLCDAAILLAGLERWGEDALESIAGNFAFALWNAQAQTLTLARDLCGHRPLHYHRGRGFFAFASMPKGLHALAEIPCAADEETAAELIALLPQTDDRSFFKDIKRVVAAHVVTVTRQGLSKRRWWTQRRAAAGLKTADYVEGLRHHFDQATRSMLRGAAGAVATQLSAGLDSAAVTATAARLFAPGKVVAFTAVPRQGYDGPDPRNRFCNEGPLAAATAAMHPNIEHVLIRSGHLSPFADLDRSVFLLDRPMPNLCNWVWARAIFQAARDRKLAVMLTGQMGNMTMSYDGLELLPELLRAGRLLRLLREIANLVGKTDMRWRGGLARTFGPFMPAVLWQWLNRVFVGHALEITDYTAIRADALRGLDLAARAAERDHDFSYRPWADSFELRNWVIGRTDPGEFGKAILAGWGIDRRDPTSDKRLIEFCLGVPTEQYLADGVPRALSKRAFADRLPRAVIEERKRGYQAADWHEGLTAAREEAAAEIERIAACAPAAQLLDIARMKRLMADWPSGGWERDAVMRPYRLALMRGVATGHFLRKASGANR